MSTTNPPSNRPWLLKLSLGLLLAAGAFGGAIYFIQQRSAQEAAASENAEIQERPPQPVSVMRVEKRRIQAWLFAEGTVRSVRREYLTFDRPGRVIFIKPGADGGDLREGEAVKEDELLARLDRRQYESDIQAAEAALDEAKVQADAARAESSQVVTQHELTQAQFRRSKDLLADKATSRSAYEEADAAMKNAAAARKASETRLKSLDSGIKSAEARLAQARLALEETEIRSPIDGIVAYLNIEEGFYFTQSNVRTSSESDALQSIPMVVIDPTEYEITVNIPAFDAGQLAVDQPTLLLSGSATEDTAVSTIVDRNTENGLRWTARGTVFSVNPAVNPGGRSVQVRIRTTEGADRLRDGMFVTSWIEVENKPDAVVAPFNAFLYDENRPYVFVVNENNVAERRDVVIGIQGLTSREIVSGIEPGERLAIDGRHRLVDGAEVRIVDEKSSQRLARDPMEDVRR